MKKSGLPINLGDLIHQRVIENERIEFKAAWNDVTKQQVVKTVCAFANDLLNTNGGYIIVGIEEKNGKAVLPPRGLENHEPDTIQKSLIGACKGFISPEYLPMIFFETFMEKEIMIAWCPAGENRPYQAPKRKGEGKTYWLRSSGVTVEAVGDLKRQLFEHAGKIPFDDRRSLTGTISDVSPDILEQFLKDIRSDIPGLRLPHEEVCDKLRLTVPVNGHKVPRNIALMLFNNTPGKFFQGTRIEVVQFPEDAGGDLIAERVFSGPVHRQIEECLHYLEGISGVLLQKVNDRPEVDRFLAYPKGAMEEAMVNAVFHRSYEYPPEPVKIYIYPDRMEITSYPGPLQGIKKEHLESGSTPSLPLRNRRIGEFLKELRMAEARGTGIPKIIRAMKENGSPPPVFDFDDDRTYFRVILPIHPRHGKLSPKNINGDISVPGQKTNYIFTYGNAESGKSTLMAAISNSFFRRYFILMNPDNELGNNLLLYDWLGKLKQMEFPAPTKNEDILEVDFDVKLDDEHIASLTFLEMSGEHLQRLDMPGKKEEHKSFEERLKDYIRKTGVFLVVVPFDNAASDDLLVWQFLNYLMSKNIDMSRLALIISKWDLNTGEQDVLTFAKENIPQTYNWLKSLHKDKLPVFPFSIGKVKDNKIQELQPGYSDAIAKHILQWLDK